MYEILSNAKLPNRFYRISIVNPEDLCNALTINVESNIPADVFTTVVKSVYTQEYPLSITSFRVTDEECEILYRKESYSLSAALNMVAGIRFFKIVTTEETMVIHKTARVYI